MQSVLPDKNVLEDCTVAYLSVKGSVSEPLQSEQELLKVLQYASRNPSLSKVKKLWPSDKGYLAFDAVIEIFKEIQPVSSDDLLQAFKKLDVNQKDFISHEELFQVLTSRGEKLTKQELRAITEDASINKDGKLDYKEFCKVIESTVEKCKKVSQEFWFYHNAELSKTTQLSSTPHTSDDSLVAVSTPIKETPVLDVHKNPIASHKFKIPEPKNLKHWHHVRSKGTFYFEDDGTILCHQYTLELTVDTNLWLIIRPYQLKHSEIKSKAPLDTAIFLLREKDGLTKHLIAATEHRNRKGYYYLRCDLEKGTYYLQPFTTGCRFKRRKSQSRTEIKLIKRDKENKLHLSKSFIEILGDIFNMVDLDGNNLLNRHEFNLFNLITSGEEVDDDEWKVALDNFEVKDGELTKKGFIDLHQMEAEDNEGDSEDLWVTLNALGYSKALELDEACPFLMDIYTEDCMGTLKITGIKAGRSFLDHALFSLTTDKGETTKFKNWNDLYLHTYITDFRATITVENKSNNRVSVRLDCSRSQNCCSHRDNLDYILEVPSRTTVIAHHLMPIDETLQWMVCCEESVIK